MWSKAITFTPNRQAVHDDLGSLKTLMTVDATYFRDNEGKTVLHCAAEKNCTNALAFILSLRADCVSDADRRGRTALHWAAACGSLEAVKFLLNHGADVFARDHRQAMPRDYVQVCFAQ